MRHRPALAVLAFSVCACGAAPPPCPEPQNTAATATAAETPAKSASPTSSAHEEAPAIERTVAAGKLTLRFDASALGNLVHQLDCLSKRMRCSREAFEALWKELGWSAEDERALAEWKALRERFEGRIQPRDEDAPPLLPLPRADTFDLGDRMRIAAFVSQNQKQHEAHLALLTTPGDAASAERLLAFFRPRFDIFWSQKGEALARKHVEGFASLCEKGGLVEEIAGAARFYAASLPEGTTLSFHVIARPKHDSLNASLQLGRHAEIEALDGEPSEERIPVIMHELYHFFYASAPWADRKALAARFLGPADPMAIVGYAALNEVLATYLGNVRIGRLVAPDELKKDLKTPLGLYAEDMIDRIVKAALPALDARLEKKQGMLEADFVDEYLAAVRAAYPKGAPMPHYLRPLLVSYDNGMKGASEELDADVRAWQFGGLVTTDLDAPDAPGYFGERARWPAAFLVTPKDLGKLGRFGEFVDASAIREIEGASKKNQSFAFASLDRAGAARLVFVAPDSASMKDLVRDILARDGFSKGILLPRAKSKN